MNELFLWLSLYCIYWFICTLLGDAMWEVTKLNWINDVIRLFGPFVFFVITYIILRKKSKKADDNARVRISDNKIIMNVLKIIGICLAIYMSMIAIMIIYSLVLQVINVL